MRSVGKEGERSTSAGEEASISSMDDEDHNGQGPPSPPSLSSSDGRGEETFWRHPLLNPSPTS